MPWPGEVTSRVSGRHRLGRTAPLPTLAARVCGLRWPTGRDTLFARPRPGLCRMRCVFRARNHSTYARVVPSETGYKLGRGSYGRPRGERARPSHSSQFLRTLPLRRVRGGAWAVRCSSGRSSRSLRRTKFSGSVRRRTPFRGGCATSCGRQGFPGPCRTHSGALSPRLSWP